ncbi:uncharacterized protein LOC110028393 [Phalaenopsis equestris]|uniref:uncharacterized protein LOC110028393 n=1 Tax=Phalaenopsis equestris TaxID=78828 RepID=UPI0009E44184|nr:uncharacterized protein LOC110028393 [Phalaenopsis equestris]
MATTLVVATTAAAVGLALLVCILGLLCILRNRPCTLKRGEDGEEQEISAVGGGCREQRWREAEIERRLSWRPAEPPSTWQEAVLAVTETIQFIYLETLGRWPIGDLAFGIKHHMRKQGLQVATVFGRSNYIKLEGPELMDELIYLSRLLYLCIAFSKKPFSVFLKCSDFCPDDIIFQKHKAGLLKPAFIILRDKSSKCILLIVRGMHSIKDTLTAAIGLMVPFHHSILDECGVSKVVLGYAHYGMVSAAHWIAKCATPYVLKAVGQYPAYQLKIVGNSLGAGIAAILTFILREHTEFSSATCIAFAPAACMTWDLADSGQDFITTIINGSDIVPTFSLVSADNLRLEVAASSWLSDLCDQFHQPFTSCAQTLSSKSQNVFIKVQKAALTFARRMDCLGILSCYEDKIKHQGTNLPIVDMDSSEIKQHPDEYFPEQIDVAGSCSNQYCNGTEEATEEEIIERKLWVVLGKELQRQEEAVSQSQEENYMRAMDKERSVYGTIGSKQPISAEEIHFFPPGRIRHIVAEQELNVSSGGSVADEPNISMYETPRHLYGKIRLWPNMIKDHYMPAYKKMIDLMIENLRKKEAAEKL